jgi:hypothetical protein
MPALIRANVYQTGLHAEQLRKNNNEPDAGAEPGKPAAARNLRLNPLKHDSAARPRLTETSESPRFAAILPGKGSVCYAL